MNYILQTSILIVLMFFIVVLFCFSGIYSTIRIILFVCKCSDDQGNAADPGAANPDIQAPAAPPVVAQPPTTKLQPAFQPTSTPLSLSHRFMVCNGTPNYIMLTLCVYIIY